VVLPALTRFGPAAERWLLEGLKSKKSFMRQGSALALASVKTARAVDALAKLLVSEPTEIWTEVARALGDVGTPAVSVLAPLVREVDADVRDRIVDALAHACARGNARPALEALGAARDVGIATAAQRALARVAEVRAADAELRRGHTTEGTVVSGFTRRFYEVLTGGGGGDTGAVELSAADLEELEEDEAVEFDDDELVTDTGIPAVSTANVLGEADSTRPTPKSTLPRGRG
jgi:HEAT repeat protein